MACLMEFWEEREVLSKLGWNGRDDCEDKGKKERMVLILERGKKN